MFYPVDSLKKGGRFYMCWVADSWPNRFALITHRQLWSQDIRKICDELIEVMRNESGRPKNRYSLRLSSQLMRGLVRLYQKKVNVFLNELCMIHANVSRHANKRLNVHEILNVPHRERVQPQVLEPPPVTVLEVEHEPRIEEMIQNSGNVVTNIQDITLKEAAIPDFQLPPNDGFGEENPEQALQLVADRTIEMMLVGGEAPSHHSGLQLADVTEPDLDKSRLLPRDIQMERISGQDITFRRSDVAGLLPGVDFEKDVPEIPEIPDVPIPDLPVPQELMQHEEQIVEIAAEVSTVEQPRKSTDRAATRVSEHIELEELEETEPQAKRRRFRRLIIDKKTQINSNFLRSRIENPKVELRCEDSSDDIIDIQVPCDVYMRRPSHAGSRDRSNLGQVLTRLFMRNLGVVNKPTRIERDIEEGVMQRSQRFTRSMLERIEEVEEPTTALERRPQAEPLPDITVTMHQDNLVPQEVDFSKDFAYATEQHREQDIGDMLTQKIDTLSQQARKRTGAYEAVSSPKRHRSVGYVSFRESQQKQQEKDITVPVVVEPTKQPEVPVFDIEADGKENVPANKQSPVKQTVRESTKSVTAMLQEAGLADIPTVQPMAMEQPPVPSQRKTSRKQGSEGSETPLGSLDRTKVSLGDSEQTTDSKRFIRDQWGTEGTMIKILKCIKTQQQVTVRSLIEKGPVIPGYKAIIAGRCFTSILKLKQNGFIKIRKCPDSSEIEDIMLGPKFY